MEFLFGAPDDDDEVEYAEEEADVGRCDGVGDVLGQKLEGNPVAVSEFAPQMAQTASGGGMTFCLRSRPGSTRPLPPTRFIAFSTY